MYSTLSSLEEGWHKKCEIQVSQSHAITGKSQPLRELTLCVILGLLEIPGTGKGLWWSPRYFKCEMQSC